MPVRGDTQINTFVKGLVTEASPLSFPPNTCLDVLNFKLQKDGTNFRRLGLDFEDNYLLTATGYSSDVLATARKAFYRWQLPNGNALVDIGVVQIGSLFWFLNLYAENPSASILNGGSPVDAGVDPSSRFSFATINNYLLVVSNNLPDPYLVTYNGDTDTITFDTSPIMVRDWWGVDDSIAVDYRPTTLSQEHKYNLLNQGWSNDIVTTCGAGVNAVDCTFNTFGIYPSNSDVWTIGKVGDLTSADVMKYDPNIAARNIFNIGQVPQGHFIISLKNRGRDRNNITGLTLPLDREVGMVACTAAYAGRAWYSGMLSKAEDGDNKSPILTGCVLFSQVFEQKIQLVRCYQEADPTSPDISDILDSDGGLIFIPECSYINHLRAVKESLFVFAVNGVWEIRGGDNGFTANSFQVNKVSNVGVYSPDSILEVDGKILFWGINGIFALGKNENGIFQTQNLTATTIQKLYNSFPDFARSQAKGFYDINSNTCRWLYYSDEAKVVGQAIDVQPPSILLGSPLEIDTAAINANILTVVRITNTKYVIVFNHKTDNKIQYIVCDVDTTTLNITATTASDLVTGIGGWLFLKATEISSTKFLLCSTSNAGFQARIINVSGTICTANPPVTIMATGGSRSLSDVIKIDVNRAIIVINRPIPSLPESLIINYSTGTPTMGATFIHANTAGSLPCLELISVGATSTVSYYDQNRARVLYITSADVITEGAALTLTSYTFSGGNLHSNTISNTEIIVGNNNQYAVITKSDPPTLVSYYNATDNGLGLDTNSIKHNMLKLKNKNQVIKFSIAINQVRYQYLGHNPPSVFLTFPATPLLTSIGDPSAQFLVPVYINETDANIAYAVINLATSKVITQCLRLL